MRKNVARHMRAYRSCAGNDLVELAGKKVVSGFVSLALAGSLTPTCPPCCLAAELLEEAHTQDAPSYSTLSDATQSSKLSTSDNLNGMRDGVGGKQTGTDNRSTTKQSPQSSAGTPSRGEPASGNSPDSNKSHQEEGGAPVISATIGAEEVVDGSLFNETGRLCVAVSDSDIRMEEGQPVGVDIFLINGVGEPVAFEDTWICEEDDSTRFMLQTKEQLADGMYELRLDAQDIMEHPVAIVVGFTVDTHAPEVHVDVAWDEAVAQEGSACYFNRPQTVEVSLSDSLLDLSRTTVNGVVLSELVKNDDVEEQGNTGIAYGSWDMLSEADHTTYTCQILYGEGMYELPIVKAFDMAGNEASEVYGTNTEAPTRFVVDVTAPDVIGTLDHVPAHVVNDEQGKDPVAFFGTDTLLELTIDDAFGIQTLALQDDAADSCGYTLQNVSEDKTHAQVELGSAPFEDTVSVVVSDHAGNTTKWSMRRRGLRMVAHETCEVENEPLRIRDSEELVSYEGHPSKLIEDKQAPHISFEGIYEGAFVNTEQCVSMRVEDENFGYIAANDAQQTVLRVYKDGVLLPSLAHVAGYDGADIRDKNHTYDVCIPANENTHEDDGTYELVATVRDLAGNETAASTSLVVDTIAPVLSVSYDDVAHVGNYFQGARTATITVADKNLTAQKLNETDVVKVTYTACDGRAASDIVVSPWQSTGKSDEYACTVYFPADATYTLRVLGSDEAGNPLTGSANTKVDGTGTYDSGIFVTDCTDPQVTFSYSSDTPQPRRHDGLDYFRKPVTVNVVVSDRNLDISRTTVTNSQGVAVVPNWEVLRHDADGTWSYVASMVYCEEETGAGSGRKAPIVCAVDCASNETHSQSSAFVVDQTAPFMDGASLCKRPSAEVRDGANADPILFFNELDGVPVCLTFLFGDEYGVDAVWVDDPDDAYDVQTTQFYGKASGTLTLTLRDFSARGVANDTEFERNIGVYVRDVAGNVRKWTLDRQGTIVADRNTETKNVALFGDLYPIALVCDSCPPRVGITGIEPGSYYNVPQTAHLAIEEHNYDYLTRFDSNRVVAVIHKLAPNGQTSNWPLLAHQFTGSRPFYAYDHTFAEDGHYRITMSFNDMAGNPSQETSLDTFTIDRTAPSLRVTWDNHDVRNGMYYRASRTATITVEEHNFDPNLFAIDTTGSVGGWATDGDIHTCIVQFNTDASRNNPHKLRVSGRDKAGNEAIPYEEPNFVIDTQAPTLFIGKRVSGDDLFALGDEVTELGDGSAFARGMAPVVELVDEANFDPTGVEVKLAGIRPTTAMGFSLAPHTNPIGDTGARVEWGNIGFSDDGDGSRYLLDADDVYTLTACVTDMAGNTSGEKSAVFSINRYGSNYFVESTGGLKRNASGEWDDVPLPEAPQIVVHEINVSGSEENGHVIFKEHAFATTEIKRTEEAQFEGYTLVDSKDTSDYNPYEGWSEYVYTIQAGNFGQGSTSDYGDGGQGSYHVDVSTLDKAHNNNSTATFWESGIARTDVDDEDEGEFPLAKKATVSFTLDEIGPRLCEINVPHSLHVGDSYSASFRIEDAITEGDRLTVLVDGESVDVYREGSQAPLVADEPVRQGTFCFLIDSKPALFPREVEISVTDYTGLVARTQSVRIGEFYVTTLATEALALTLIGGLCAIVAIVVRRRLRATEPPAPTKV